MSRNGKTWQVLIMINRNKNYIGNFKSEDEAAKVYDEYAMKYHKNKARLNFPHQGFIKYINKPWILFNFSFFIQKIFPCK